MATRAGFNYRGQEGEGRAIVVRDVQRQTRIADMDLAGAGRHYEGDRGQDYHARRAEARSSRSQAVRRDYFQELTGPGDVLLDFGCATGEVAAGLPARLRWGVEINEAAAAEARKRLDLVVPSLAEIADSSVDRLISFHAIEHVGDPIGLFAQFRRVMRPGARGRLIVPYEAIVLSPGHRSWSAADPDMHLFAWTPLTFGNALASAGLEVERARVTHWGGAGRLGGMLRPFGMQQLGRWVTSLRLRRLQIVADFIRA